MRIPFLSQVLAADPGKLPLPRWLLELLSVDTENLQGATGHVRFARFPEGGWGLLTILVIALGFSVVLWLYRREGHLSRARQITMGSLRCLLLVALALVLFYPALEIDRERTLRATTIVLVDESLSQGIKDRYLSSPVLRESIASAFELEEDAVPALTRARLVELALERPEWNVLPRLAEKNRLKVYGFSHLPLRPLSWQDATGEPPRGGLDAAPKPPSPSERPPGPSSPDEYSRDPVSIDLRPLGETTDLAGAIRSAVELEAGTRVAGVVVITDGRVTAGEDLKGIAGFLREQSIPVHAVGVGDPAPTRNLRMSAMLATERVFVGDPVVVDVRVEHRGFAGRSVRVELLDQHETPGGPPPPPVVIESREVVFSEDRPEESLSFQFQPQGLGAHRLVARMDVDPEETFQEDNERAVTVEVVEEASKVLLVSGGPSYEYRYLKNLLKRDARITLSGWLTSADPDYPQEGNVVLRRLPSTRKELFAYDVVILMDVDPKALPAELIPLLEEFVSTHHGGLAYVAGDKYTLSLFESATAGPIRDVLPVQVDLGDVRDELEQGKFYEREWALVPTPEASDHAATRLSSRPDRNRQRWAEIAGFYWSFPARKVKPGATALMVHPDPILQRDGSPRPLVVTQYYGGGRVMWCGIDSTWRWRALAEEVYDRFWIQSVRFLTEGRLAGEERQMIQTDRDEYDLGETIRITARLVDESYQPVGAEEYVVTVEAPDGSASTLTLQSDPGSPGWYHGIYTPLELGTYRVATPGGGPRHQVRVAPPRLEFQVPELDESALRELARMTGGSYAPLSELDSLPDRVPDRRQTIVATDEPIPLWDNWLSLGLLGGLLTLEWILRKVNRLL